MIKGKGGILSAFVSPSADEGDLESPNR